LEVYKIAEISMISSEFRELKKGFLNLKEMESIGSDISIKSLKT
jgi:hypothetical protein